MYIKSTTLTQEHGNFGRECTVKRFFLCMSKRTGLSKQRELKSEQLSRNNDVILTQQGYDNIPRLPMLIPCECRRV